MDDARRLTDGIFGLPTIHHLVLGLVITFCLVLHHPVQLHAQEDRAGVKNSGPWQISADKKIEYDQYRGVYVAEGNVEVSRGEQTLTADKVQLDHQNQKAFAIGNVRLLSGRDILSGAALQLDLERETGEINDGALFISENHLYLSGDLIRKTGPQTYTADRFTVTACDGPDPDWKFTGQDLKVTIEGYGFAKHAAFWAGKIPLLYSPFLVFPVKLKRQSGLLMPEIGYSKRKGAQYLQPLYWAINESSDATVYAHYMSERGVRTGLEYRYMLSESNFGALFVEGFTDRRVDEGTTTDTSKWGYGDDTAPRPNEDRYWIRMKHDHDLFRGLKTKLDLDVVSDQDYLHEFDSGYNGFIATRNYFRKSFGREIDDEIDAVRLNRLNMNGTWDHYTLNTDLRWYDDVITRRQNLTDDTLQQLPVVTFDGAQQPAGRWPLYYDLASSYVHFYSEDAVRGHRIDLSPRIYLPLRLFNALTVAPSAGLRATAWYLDQDASAIEPDKKDFQRTLVDMKIDTDAEFFRLFKVSMGASDQIKHAITPQVFYEYIPEKDQSELPEFDDYDRIAAKDLITYSLTNTLTSRTPQETKEGQPDFTYHTFLRLKLTQSYDFNKHDQNDPEPFTDITAELDIMPKRYIRLDVDGDWSIYDDELTRFNTTLTLWDNRDDRLSVTYQNQRESSPGADDGNESITLKAELKLNAHWRLQGAYERDLYENEDIETTFGMDYQSQCWGVAFEYTKEEDDRRYSVMVNLLTLGSIGN